MMVLIHSWNRWLVLTALVLSLLTRGKGQRALMAVATFQFCLGLWLAWPYLVAFWSVPSAGLRVKELRFFGLEHPLMMVMVVGLIHAGAVRVLRGQARGLILQALALVLALAGIPWFRPLFRL